MSFKTIKTFAILALMLISFSTLVGCGGDEAQIKGVAKKMVKATKKGDIDMLLECVGNDSKKMISMILSDDKAKKELSEELKKEGKKMGKVKYGEVKVDGDKATMEVTSTVDGKKEDETLSFIKEDGKWVVAEM